MRHNNIKIKIMNMSIICSTWLFENLSLQAPYYFPSYDLNKKSHDFSHIISIHTKMLCNQIHKEDNYLGLIQNNYFNIKNIHHFLSRITCLN